MLQSKAPRLHAPRALPAALILLAAAVAARFASAEPSSLIKPVRSSPMDNLAGFRRFLWVSRWEYKSAADVEKVFYNAASDRFTDVFFQVRGNGTVFFKSPYEPWAWELSSSEMAVGLGRDPGWDPLATAIREGHKRGIRVHAWINAMPAWSQDASPPKNVSQLYTRRPSWLMTDSSGRRMTPSGFYAFLEPGLPEVREYLALLIGRMAQDYEVDGVHLDYIRYPLADEAGREYSFHPDVVEAFRKKYHTTPQENRAQWAAFKREQVSATIREIRKAVKAARPNAELSATTMAHVDRAMGEAGQEAQRWIEEGLVEAVVPMVYVQNDLDRFLRFTEPYFNNAKRVHAWIGIWPRTANPGYVEQVKACSAAGVAGVAIFSYGELFTEQRANERSVKLYAAFTGGGKSGGMDRPDASIASAEPKTSAPAASVHKKSAPTPREKAVAKATPAKKPEIKTASAKTTDPKPAEKKAQPKSAAVKPAAKPVKKPETATVSAKKTPKAKSGPPNIGVASAGEPEDEFTSKPHPQ